MKRIVTSILLAALVMGAVYGVASFLPVSGGILDAGTATVTFTCSDGECTDVTCTNGSGILQGVDCTL